MARIKKTRTMRGKLGKTGTKEMMKEQKKAQKSKEVRRFHSKKVKLRKEQAQKKLARLGLLPEVVEVKPVQRARRFIYVAPIVANEAQPALAAKIETTELTVDDLMSAFTEAN